MIKKTTCEKCGFESEQNKKRFGLALCSVCYSFAPSTPEELDKYLEEKIPKESINVFRKYATFKGENQKRGMIKKSIKGNVMSRPAFGYKIISGELIPAENSREIEEIFEEFLNEKISLRQLAEKHNLSVNGLKKVLSNFTYIGKIKFNNQIHDGNHKPIISTTLFNHVQNKLDKMKIKRSV